MKNEKKHQNICTVKKNTVTLHPKQSQGEMAEWSIAAVLKTVEGHTSGGSNPSLSAEIVRKRNFGNKLRFNFGKMPEWTNGPHSKCGERVTAPGVRIPLFPQKGATCKGCSFLRRGMRTPGFVTAKRLRKQESLSFRRKEQPARVAPFCVEG